MEKLCMFCKNFVWTEVTHEQLGPSVGCFMEGGARCMADHFSEERPDDTDEFRQLILQAETCPDYAPPNVKVSGLARPFAQGPLDRRVGRLEAAVPPAPTLEGGAKCE